VFGKRIDNFLESSHGDLAIDGSIVTITANRSCALVDYSVPKTKFDGHEQKDLQVSDALVNLHNRLDESFFLRFRLLLFCGGHGCQHNVK